MNNEDIIESSYLYDNHPVESFESSISIKKRIEKYTKQFARIFNFEMTRISEETDKSIGPHNIGSLENSEVSNVVENIEIIPSNGTEMNGHSSSVKTNCYSLENQFKTGKNSIDDNEGKNNVSDHKCINDSDDFITKSPVDYMKRLEKFVYDFDKANDSMKVARRDSIDVSSETLNLSGSSDNDKAKRLDMSSDESIKKDFSSKISNNCLLEEAVAQLRTEFKEFFVKFEMKNGALKLPRDDKNERQLLAKNRKELKKHEIKKKDNETNVVDLIENLKRSRGKQSILYQNFHNQKFEMPPRHFDAEGFCVRTKNCSTSATKNKSVVAKKLKERTDKFTRVFSKGDQIGNSLIPVITSRTSSNPGKIPVKTPHDKKKEPDSVEDSNLSTCKVAVVEDEKSIRVSSDTNQPIIKWYNSFIRRKKALKKFPKTDGGMHPTETSGKATKDGNNPGRRRGISFLFELRDKGKATNKGGSSSLKGKEEPTEKASTDANQSTKKADNYINEIDRNPNISGGVDVGEMSSKDEINFLCESAASSSTETASECSYPQLSPIKINKSLGGSLGITYVKPDQLKDENTASPMENPPSTVNFKEDDEVGDVLCPLVKPVLPKIRNPQGTSTNMMLCEYNTKKILDVYSLPVGGNEPINDSSDTLSEQICYNLQSTCLYFDEKQKVSECVAVLIPEIADADSTLENVGEYEDFEKDLLLCHNKLTSESNQTV